MTVPSQADQPQALLVIDVQVGTIDPNDSIDRSVLDNIAALLERARSSGTPVVYMQHHSFEPGDDLVPDNPAYPIHPEVAPREGETVIVKHSSDSFHNTDLDAQLKALNVGHIAVAGCATDFCVDTTCRSALSHGYNVTLASDGHTTGSDGDLDVEAIIKHHNKSLAWIAIEDTKIKVVPVSEIFS